MSTASDAVNVIADEGASVVVTVPPVPPEPEPPLAPAEPLEPLEPPALVAPAEPLEPPVVVAPAEPLEPLEPPVPVAPAEPPAGACVVLGDLPPPEQAARASARTIASDRIVIRTGSVSPSPSIYPRCYASKNLLAGSEA